MINLIEYKEGDSVEKSFRAFRKNLQESMHVYDLMSGIAFEGAPRRHTEQLANKISIYLGKPKLQVVEYRGQFVIDIKPSK